MAFAAFGATLFCMGLATHRRYCRVGDPNCHTQRGFWLWLSLSAPAFAIGNTLMKAAGRQADPGGLLSYASVRCLVVAAEVAVCCRISGARPTRDRRMLLLALAFAAAFLPAIFGLVWSLVFGNRPPKLAWLGAALAALSIWLLHASG